MYRRQEREREAMYARQVREREGLRKRHEQEMKAGGGAQSATVASGHRRTTAQSPTTLGPRMTPSRRHLTGMG